MPNKFKLEKMRRKHESEEAKKAPMAIIVNLKTDGDSEADDAIKVLHDIFDRVLIFYYTLPLNGRFDEFERMSKKADYLLFVGSVIPEAPEEINRKLEFIIKANYKITIINQTSFNFPSLARRKVVKIKKITKSEIERSMK